MTLNQLPVRRWRRAAGIAPSCRRPKRPGGLEGVNGEGIASAGAGRRSLDQRGREAVDGEINDGRSIARAGITSPVATRARARSRPYPGAPRLPPRGVDQAPEQMRPHVLKLD